MLCEIEFVCVNPEFTDSTKLENQENLYQELKKLDGIYICRQDWSEYSPGQISLSVIYENEKLKPKILKLAHKHNVLIDLEHEVSLDYLRSILDKSIENYIEDLPKKTLKKV